MFFMSYNHFVCLFFVAVVPICFVRVSSLDGLPLLIILKSFSSTGPPSHEHSRSSKLMSNIGSGPVYPALFSLSSICFLISSCSTYFLFAASTPHTSLCASMFMYSHCHVLSTCSAARLMFRVIILSLTLCRIGCGNTCHLPRCSLGTLGRGLPHLLSFISVYSSNVGYLFARQDLEHVRYPGNTIYHRCYRYITKIRT